MSDRIGKRKWDDGDEKQVLDPAAQAAAIAARIAATIAPPPVSGSPSSDSAADRSALRVRDEDKYDGQFTHDIEINDLRNRYLVTKGSTQQQIASETGASVTTKGVWLPDKSKASGDDRPLYIHIAAPTQEQLDVATKKVQEVIDSELGPLVEDRSTWARNRERFGAPPGPGGEAAGAPAGPPARRKWPEEKIPIGLESLRNFNVRAKVVGPGGMFVKYIQAETGTRVQIKGMGSGFYENDTGVESTDPMHVNISGPDDAQVARAKDLANDLLEVVREEWTKASNAGGSGGGYGGGQGGYGGYQQQGQQGHPGQQGGYAGYYGQQQQQQNAYGQPPLPGTDGQQQPPLPGVAGAGAGSPTAAGATPTTTGDAASQDPAAQYEAYRAYWAAYGYDVNDPAFQAWQATQMGGGAQDPAAAGAGAAGTPNAGTSAGAGAGVAPSGQGSPTSAVTGSAAASAPIA